MEKDFYDLTIKKINNKFEVSEENRIIFADGLEEVYSGVLSILSERANPECYKEIKGANLVNKLKGHEYFCSDPVIKSIVNFYNTLIYRTKTD
jgi:hypothetical protein